jgi:hypothetical protein
VPAGCDTGGNASDREVGRGNLDEVQDGTVPDGLPATDPCRMVLDERVVSMARDCLSDSASRRRLRNSREAAIGSRNLACSCWSSSTLKNGTSG